MQLADSSDLSFDKHYKYQYRTFQKIPTTHLMSEVEKSGGDLVSEEFRLGSLHDSWVDMQLADSSDLSFDKHYKYQYRTFQKIPTTHLMSEVEKSGGDLVSEEFRLGSLHDSWVRTTCSSLQTTPPKDQQK
ncbi:hypothetical protein E2I00_005387, partial [Balaenoptera physalus]